jgi:heme-degrading monooxygenase HmoA
MVSRSLEINPPAQQLAKDQSFLLVATYLPLRSYWKVIPFIRLSLKIEAQLRSSRGIVRYELRTDIPHKRFWTLSVWTSRDDMALFSRSEPHRTAMMKFYDWGTDEAGIAEWTATDGRIDWTEAHKRLETPMFHYKYLDEKRLVHAPGSRNVSTEKEGTNNNPNESTS